ncbi:MAG TPA: PAS domain-containing protein [Terriglobia bacterium]|nr:PAS domain-containing protein [Terriglobia bacterium]
MEYNKLSKTELVRILEDIRSPRFGPGKSVQPDHISIMEALLLERYELNAQIQSLKDSFSRVDESLTGYLELFENAPLGYVVLDPAGCIVKMNPPACALVRRDRTVVAGISFTAMLTDGSRSVFRKHFAECRRFENEVKSVALDLLIEEVALPIVMIGCFPSTYRGILLLPAQLP